MKTATYATKNYSNSAYSTFDANGEIISNGAFEIEGLKLVAEGFVRNIFQSYMFNKGLKLEGSFWVKDQDRVIC